MISKGRRLFSSGMSISPLGVSFGLELRLERIVDFWRFMISGESCTTKKSIRWTPGRADAIF